MLLITFWVFPCASVYYIRIVVYFILVCDTTIIKSNRISHPSCRCCHFAMLSFHIGIWLTQCHFSLLRNLVLTKVKYWDLKIKTTKLRFKKILELFLTWGPIGLNIQNTTPPRLMIPFSQTFSYFFPVTVVTKVRKWVVAHILEMSNRAAKRIEIWDSAVLVSHVCGTFAQVVFRSHRHFNSTLKD